MQNLLQECSYKAASWPSFVTAASCCGCKPASTSRNVEEKADPRRGGVRCGTGDQIMKSDSRSHRKQEPYQLAEKDDTGHGRSRRGTFENETRCRYATDDRESKSVHQLVEADDAGAQQSARDVKGIQTMRSLNAESKPHQLVEIDDAGRRTPSQGRFETKT